MEAGKYYAFDRLYFNTGSSSLDANSMNQIENVAAIMKAYPKVNILNYNYEWFQFNTQDQYWSNHIYACNTKYLKEVVIPLLKHNRDNNKALDVKYQELEDTLNFTDKIPNQTEYIKELIVKHNMRNIYSGGGNFYHKK